MRKINLKIISLALLLLLPFNLMTACDYNKNTDYLIKASQDEIVEFLSAHKDTIREEYVEWNGSILDFNTSILIPVPLEEKQDLQLTFSLGGKFSNSNYILSSCSPHDFSLPLRHC